jgi:hypothetical protein
MNRPKTFVYLVRPISYSPSEDQRREQFLESGLTPPVYVQADQDRREVYTRWYEQVKEEMEVAWQRTPQPATMAR